MTFLKFCLRLGFGTAAALFILAFLVVVSGFLEGSKKFTKLKIK